MYLEKYCKYSEYCEATTHMQLDNMTSLHQLLCWFGRQARDLVPFDVTLMTDLNLHTF